MTREQAIRTAILRVRESRETLNYDLMQMLLVNYVPPPFRYAVRRHFAIVCRQYGIEPHYNDAPSGSGMWIL